MKITRADPNFRWAYMSEGMFSHVTVNKKVSTASRAEQFLFQSLYI